MPRSDTARAGISPEGARAARSAGAGWHRRLAAQSRAESSRTQQDMTRSVPVGRRGDLHEARIGQLRLSLVYRHQDQKPAKPMTAFDACSMPPTAAAWRWCSTRTTCRSIGWASRAPSPPRDRRRARHRALELGTQSFNADGSAAITIGQRLHARILRVAPTPRMPSRPFRRWRRRSGRSSTGPRRDA